MFLFYVKIHWRKINTNFEQKIKTTQKEVTTKFPRVVETFEAGIEEINHDAVEASSKNLKVSRKSSTRSTSDFNV